MDFDAIQAGALALRGCPEDCSSAEDIEAYTDYLMKFLRDLVELTVPWAKPSSKANPWWTQEIQELVKEERQWRKRWQNTSDERAYAMRRRAGNKKKKLISWEKRRAFREDIHQAAESQRVYDL
jgi:hypothetical protein